MNQQQVTTGSKYLSQIAKVYNVFSFSTLKLRANSKEHSQPAATKSFAYFRAHEQRQTIGSEQHQWNFLYERKTISNE